MGTTPQTAEQMIEALKASIERANRVALAERLAGADPFTAKLAALDALIAGKDGAR